MLVLLAVARTDILAAHAACDLLVQQAPTPAGPLYAALNSALVVAYGRPFTGNKPLGPLPPEWSWFDNPRHQELHDDLLRHRHQWIAHSDLRDDRKVVIVPNGARFTPSGPPSPGGIGVETAMFAPNVILEIRDLCAALYDRLHAETERLLDIVYPPSFYAPAPIEIYLSDL